MITDFWTWITESRQPHIEPAVKTGYELAFRAELKRLIARTHDPSLRSKFQEMLDCPIRNSRGICTSFTNYILGALIKSGVYARYDMEAALSYVFEKMMMDKTDTGEPRITVFGGFDEKRPDAMQGNPLQARFMKYLQYAVNNIARGRIPRLQRTEPRPQGTVSIGQGRSKEGERMYGISPDKIGSRPSSDGDLGDMIGDIEELLRRKETSGLPLTAMFRAMMDGQTTRQQRQQFGDSQAQTGRQIIIQTIEDYARSTENHFLSHLLAKLKDGQTVAKAAKTIRPVRSDKQRDYESIASVIARFERPVGTSDLGRFRRQWLAYPPRDPSSGHRNRMEEILEKMTQDGVLKATRTKAGALVYSPGPHFDQYRTIQTEYNYSQ